MKNDNPYVYDKAKYHFEEVGENNLPEAHANHHTTFFLSWLIKNNLISDWFELEGKSELSNYRAEQISVNDLYDWLDNCLASDMLSEQGNSFSKYYFDFDAGAYLEDYKTHLQKSLPTEFHVAYPQENETLIHDVISRRYDEWKEAIKR